jgi:hypothetical protein
LISLLGQAFFTLPLDYSIQLHTQLWEMAEYGNAFTWKEVYTMPIHWRKFYFKKLLDAKKKEKTEMDKVNKKGGSSPNVRVRK